MLQPRLFPSADKLQHILCLGAHCDDIEIGCGGTLLSLMASNPNIAVTWVVFAATAQRKLEATKGAELFTKNARQLTLKIFDFRDGFIPYVGEQVKELFEQLKQELKTPDVIFTHYRNDLHQDHRKLNELTWNTFRDHLIFEYEIPKWDGDMGSPNVFFPITTDVGATKVRLLQQAYNSQQAKNWFTDDLFWSLMRIRGMECHSPTKFAEAFYVRKLVIGV